MMSLWICIPNYVQAFYWILHEKCFNLRPTLVFWLDVVVSYRITNVQEHPLEKSKWIFPPFPIFGKLQSVNLCVKKISFPKLILIRRSSDFISKLRDHFWEDLSSGFSIKGLDLKIYSFLQQHSLAISTSKFTVLVHFLSFSKLCCCKNE